MTIIKATMLGFEELIFSLLMVNGGAEVAIPLNIIRSKNKLLSFSQEITKFMNFVDQ